MDDVIPLPRLVGAIIADVTRWYHLTGSWLLAITTVLVGLLDYIDCIRGVCRHV